MKIKATIAIVLLCAASAVAQTKAPAGGAVAPQAAPANPPAPSKAETVEPKESTDSLKLELALERQRVIQGKAIALQDQAMKSIEPQLAPMRADFDAQVKVVTGEMATVKKENGFGDDIVLDQNLNSPTFGKWIKTKK